MVHSTDANRKRGRVARKAPRAKIIVAQQGVEGTTAEASGSGSKSGKTSERQNKHQKGGMRQKGAKRGGKKQK